MKNGIIFYCSEHHGNTEKLVKELCKNCQDMEAVSLMDQEVETIDLSVYDTVGFASGVYMAKPHHLLLKYIEEHKDQLHDKNIALILTSGSNQESYGRWFISYVSERGLRTAGCYQCKGWDTYGFWKYIGGIAKKHPNQKDVAAGQKFLSSVTKN